LTLEASPSQSRPLCSGAGFVQVLVEICTPVPQVVEHSENSLHVSQPPSTKMNKNNLSINAISYRRN
jgi:hypothetical protein